MKVSSEVRATVTAYLVNLRAPVRKGRRRTVDSVNAQLEEVGKRLAVAEEKGDAVGFITLVQEKLNLQRELTRVTATEDPAVVEEGFVKVVREFSEALGITYEAWREVGVPAAVLRRGGMTR